MFGIKENKGVVPYHLLGISVRVPGTCREITSLLNVVLSPAETGEHGEARELTKCTKDDNRSRLYGTVYEHMSAVHYRFADELTGLWERDENDMLVFRDIDAMVHQVRTLYAMSLAA
jgi:hypothetical protein